ncbi:GNAT family N-acetyltransferase [Paraburkholderia sediminicola]|uniref:GNAT family N-acetyltransferase n=1 Tax=Paraburkholderia rhynchosiae TaxID=487049 RepID=A0ACC7N3X9_9BURK
MFPISEASKAVSRNGPAPPPRRVLTPSNLILDRERSIFHETWWLDIASGGRWTLATVEESGTIVGEMPYYVSRKGVWRACVNPPLTRTLGPLIVDSGQSPMAEFQHRVSVTTKLIEQIPRVDRFFQVFDPRIRDAVAFSLNGYNVSLGFTFRISCEQTREEAWRRIRKYTRNLIVKAEQELTVKTVPSADDFLNFYNANLADRKQRNAYGTQVMGDLVKAFIYRNAGTIIGAYSTDGVMVAAVGLVWDSRTMYYLLTTRAQEAHSGSISLLIWNAIQIAIQRKLVLDLDGIASPSIYRFLSSFGGSLDQRIEAERMTTTYSLAQTLHRRILSRTSNGATL